MINLHRFNTKIVSFVYGQNDFTVTHDLDTDKVSVEIVFEQGDAYRDSVSFSFLSVDEFRRFFDTMKGILD